MADASFDQALPFVLRWEGGYVNHPADPGGATNRGVTQKVYDAWRAQHDQPVRSVRNLDDAEMRAIYRSGYWMPPHCELLARKLDVVQFDTAVNMGVGRAVRFLQGAIGCTADGDFGPATRDALARADIASTIVSYCDARAAYYDRLIARNPKLAVFRRGWMNRLNALRAEAGLPGHTTRGGVDFGDTDGVKRVPDVGIDPAFDV
jgi:lysozyme family protein